MFEEGGRDGAASRGQCCAVSMCGWNVREIRAVQAKLTRWGLLWYELNECRILFFLKNGSGLGEAQRVV